MYDSIINADTTAFLTIGFSIAAIIGTALSVYWKKTRIMSRDQMTSLKCFIGLTGVLIVAVLWYLIYF